MKYAWNRSIYNKCFKVQRQWILSLTRYVKKRKRKRKSTTSQMIFFVTSSTLLLINHTVQADTYLVNMRMPILIMNCLWRCRSDAREEGWMCQVKLVFLNAKMIHYSFMNFIFDKTGKKRKYYFILLNHNTICIRVT